MRIPSGKTDQVIYFVAVDPTDLKTRKTGLTTFTVYRSRNGAAATAFTTPTITELSSANMPGVYSLLINQDTTIASTSDAEEFCVHITQASMAPVSRTFELFRRDTTSGTTALVDANGRVDVAKIAGTAQTARDIGASVLISSGTGTGQLSVTAGVIASNMTQLLGTAAATPSTAGIIEVNLKNIANAAVSATTAQIGTNVVNAGGVAWGSGAITAASIATGAFTSVKFAANALDAVWSTATRILTAGTNIVLAKGTGLTGLNDLDAPGVRTAVGMASANLDTQLSTLSGNDTTINGNVLAVKTQTDKMAFTVANQVDVNVVDWKGAAAPAMTGDAFARLGAPSGASVSVDIAALPNANANADALLDRAAGVEAGLTVRQAYRLFASALLGKANGLGTGTAHFRDMNDSKDRITATVDSSGNRATVTLDPS